MSGIGSFPRAAASTSPACECATSASEATSIP